MFPEHDIIIDKFGGEKLFVAERYTVDSQLSLDSREGVVYLEQAWGVMEYM